MRTTNPVIGIERNREKKRQRIPTPEEFKRLTAALAAHKNQVAANAIRLALLTGTRRGEILSLRWDELDDLDNPMAAATKPEEGTKQARIHAIALNLDARVLLLGMRETRGNSPWVFPRLRRPRQVLKGTAPEHITTIKSAWAVLCREAGLVDLRLHDLRHVGPSLLLSDGWSLEMIGKLLGHSDRTMSARYSHLLSQADRAMTERLSVLVNAAAKGAVLPFRRQA
jgi:integrase